MNEGTANAYAGSRLGGNANMVPNGVSAAPAPDTLTAVLGHLDEMISMTRSSMERTTKIADALAPPAPPEVNTKVAGRIDAAPDAGPILFRLQNRTNELHRLMHELAMQQCRIENVL